MDRLRIEKHPYNMIQLKISFLEYFFFMKIYFPYISLLSSNNCFQGLIDFNRVESVLH